jgi:hypothetical protein
MCCSDRIVRVTYPKKCCPEINDSQQLIYPGPALQCIEVQTNQTLNDAIKEIDALICNTLNNLTTTTTTTTTQFVPLSLCFSIYGEGFDPTNCVVSAEEGLINGKPYYKAVIDDCVTQSEGGPGEFYYIWWSNSGDFANSWVVAPLENATTGNVLSYLSTSPLPIYPLGNWTVTFVSTSYYITSSNFECPTTTTTTTIIT